jgi:hypothetical protein
LIDARGCQVVFAADERRDAADAISPLSSSFRRHFFSLMPIFIIADATPLAFDAATPQAFRGFDLRHYWLYRFRHAIDFFATLRHADFTLSFSARFSPIIAFRHFRHY